MKLKRDFGWRTLATGVFVLTVALAFAWLGLSGSVTTAQPPEPPFTAEFRLEDCEFKTKGANPYFLLKPGYQLVLEGEEGGETIRAVVTVLRETEQLYLPGIGVVKTRVVEEREWVDDELVEVSRNFFARCNQTNGVFYFGEDVDIYHPDGTVSHDGAWRAGEPDQDGLAEPGLMMPGTFLLGSRYLQEQADGEAMDRGENVEMGLTVTTQAGTFDGCVRVLETTPLEPKEESEKVYCPGVGLVVDDVIELAEFGFDLVDLED